MAQCVTGKKMYPTAQMAEDALIEAWVKNDYPAGKGPISIYKCEDCGNFHLTSSGTINPSLSSFINDGKLKLRKEANYWLDKFKK
jgi:hypothetical protein